MTASLSPPRTDAARAALLMTAAMALFAAMAVLVRAASETLPTLEVVFFRVFFGLLAFAPLIARRGPALLRTRRIGAHAARAAIGAVAMTSGFLALALIPIAEATALGFTAPLFATLGAVLALGERIRAHRIAALGIGFVGALVVLRPGFEAVSLGAALALLSALAIAVSTLIVKRLIETEPAEAVAIWLMVLMTPLTLVPALFVWVWPTPSELLLLGALAACGSAAHLCWTRAWTLAEIGALQPLEFLKLPLTAAAGWALFGETPGLAVWLGGALIFAGAAYIAHREARAPGSRRVAGAAGAGLEPRAPPPDRR